MTAVVPNDAVEVVVLNVNPGVVFRPKTNNGKKSVQPNSIFWKWNSMTHSREVCRNLAIIFMRLRSKLDIFCPFSQKENYFKTFDM